jgi:hypothetical protein
MSVLKFAMKLLLVVGGWLIWPPLGVAVALPAISGYARPFVIDNAPFWNVRHILGFGLPWGTLIRRGGRDFLCHKLMDYRGNFVFPGYGGCLVYRVSATFRRYLQESGANGYDRMGVLHLVASRAEFHFLTRVLSSEQDERGGGVGEVGDYSAVRVTTPQLRAVPWSRLRSLGNSQAVKLTIFIPIIGYLVVFNEYLIKYLIYQKRFLVGRLSARPMSLGVWFLYISASHSLLLERCCISFFAQISSRNTAMTLIT